MRRFAYFKRFLHEEIGKTVRVTRVIIYQNPSITTNYILMIRVGSASVRLVDVVVISQLSLISPSIYLISTNMFIVLIIY